MAAAAAACLGQMASAAAAVAAAAALGYMAAAAAAAAAAIGLKFHPFFLNYGKMIRGKRQTM